MSYPLPVEEWVILSPPERPVRVRARISSPPAVEHDSYLGGTATGHRLTYSDAKQYVWWTDGSEPEPTGAGFGNGFSSGFEGGVGSPTGSGFATGFSEGFR